MKRLLSFGGASLLVSAFLDPLISSGLDRPIPWLRDLLMGMGGVACLYLLVKYRKEL